MFSTLSLLLSSSHQETAPELCCGWHVSSGPELNNRDSTSTVSFTIHAKESNKQRLISIAKDVSNPESINYGQYLTSATIDALTAPTNEDVNTINTWLSTIDDATVKLHRGRTFQVEMPVTSAEKLLKTKFSLLTNKKTHQTSTRAGDYSIPRAVKDASDTIMGLHGLPLPPKVTAPPATPADVTPSIIVSQYGVVGVTPSSSSGNIQAVAEFQGQTMSSSDLKQFFTKFVPNAPSGSGTVSKFVGDNGDKTGETEASLDIQYIMGVAPGISTEFWLYDPSDFCADLKNWTSTLLTIESPPLVTSVSYGWQGSLTQIGCKDADAQAVDADFVKLAAKGITIIFASGDSGSGYTPPETPCSKNEANTELTGTVGSVIAVRSFDECCEKGSQTGAGWTFDGTNQPPAPQKCNSGPAGTAYQGDVKETLVVQEQDGAAICCDLTNDFKGVGYSLTGRNCTIFKTITGTVIQPNTTSAKSGSLTPPQNCTVFSTVTGKTTTSGKTSGTAGSSAPPVLYPSWPASSPWVTAVGATRFVGNKVGNEEMATDQFGSGGGFSKQFNQSPNAQWQSTDVASYLKNVPKGPTFPPAGSFPPLGRATPDVCALGEGYQVVQNGRVISVGGTSASTPTFAGIISLLNEARLQKGKVPLGYLNAFLYQNLDAFVDVTKGTNAIGRGTGPSKYGFNATTGWDPATGMGSPDFKKLLAAALALK